MSFNTSTRKNDMSVKLKAQNLRNAQYETQQLELESRKMEERLLELKMAMSREKEEREQQGGGFWRSGQTGSLITYGKDAVNKPPSAKPSSGKRRRVKVLKDEPITVPENNRSPGTMAHIASREASGKNMRQKGPRCGQCEMKVAHVSCLECGEDYCAGCFASFHLRGALKKHRSVPVGSNGTRLVSPKPAAPSRVTSAHHRLKTSPRTPEINPENLTPADLGLSVLSANGVSRKSPVGASRSFEGPSLLDGHFDEDAGKAAFQDALNAWRGGKSAETQNNKNAPKKSPRNQAASTEHGTSTVEQEKTPIEIKFKSNLTYAERLLLKKYRRADLKPLPPELNGVKGSSPRAEIADDDAEWPHMDPIEFLKAQWEEEEDPEHARFEARRKNIAPHDSGMDDYRPDSRISIIELDENERVPRKMEKSSSYKVTEQAEDDQNYSASSQTARKRKEAFVSPSVTPRMAVSSASRRVLSSRAKYSTEMESTHNTDLSAKKSGEHGSDSSASKRDLQQSARRPNSRTKIQKDNRNLVRQSNQDSKDSDNKFDISEHKDVAKRPKSTSKSRPVSRTDSRGPSRAGSSMSRPASRARSRASSRLALFGEGVLTKGPSDALKEIARLGKGEELENLAPDYKTNLGDFFTAGIVPNPNEERVLTPSSLKKKADNPQTERYRISNKLYQITPRSWRPDSSLGEKVPDDEVKQILKETVTDDYKQFMSSDGTTVNSENTMTWTWSKSVSDMAKAESQIEPKHSLSNQEKITASAKRKSAQLSSRPSSATKPAKGPTPRQSSSRPKSGARNVHTPGRPVSASGRESRMIVMDGQDLSVFDDVEGDKRREEQEEEEESLHQLEWELASQDGRITADGKISRAGMLSPDLTDKDDPKMSSWKPDQREGFDINQHLRESELMDDFEEMEAIIMAEEVKALD